VLAGCTGEGGREVTPGSLDQADRPVQKEAAAAREYGKLAFSGFIRGPADVRVYEFSIAKGETAMFTIESDSRGQTPVAPRVDVFDFTDPQKPQDIGASIGQPRREKDGFGLFIGGVSLPPAPRDTTLRVAVQAILTESAPYESPSLGLGAYRLRVQFGQKHPLAADPVCAKTVSGLEIRLLPCPSPTVCLPLDSRRAAFTCRPDTSICTPGNDISCTGGGGVNRDGLSCQPASADYQTAACVSKYEII
jgi:hypothetical protein